MIPELETLATGRTDSIFTSDLTDHKDSLRENIENTRIAVIGAAGSIGGAVVKQILRFSPSSLAMFDLSENNLVELVRDLRSTPDLHLPSDFRALPIGLGSSEFMRFFLESKPFHYVFNLSAIKHVRSEKDVYTLMRMIATNVVWPHEFLSYLPYELTRFFSVSSDKAAHPANLMGASKMVMEEVLAAHSNRHPAASARFANVAFSDGSLPCGFLRRLEKRQPLSAPRDIKRYFISHQEAGELCVLAGVLGENRDVFFPKREPLREAIHFSQIAKSLLELRGYRAIECNSEEEAKTLVDELIPRKEWPCYFFKSDTTGEKPLEEFYTSEDAVDLRRFKSAGVIHRKDSPAASTALEEFLTFSNRFLSESGIPKEEIVAAFKRVVPGLSHVETGMNLDNKM